MARESLTKSLPGNTATRAEAALVLGTAIKLARTGSAPIKRIIFYGPCRYNSIAANVIVKNEEDIFPVLSRLDTGIVAKTKTIEDKTGERSGFVYAAALSGNPNVDKIGNFDFVFIGNNCATVDVNGIAERQRKLLKEKALK